MIELSHEVTENPGVKVFCDELQKKIEVQIENSALDKETKDFLRKASYRFIKFDFTKIAEYYSHIENSEEKELFELLALVIIDFNKAIENGFIEMQNEFEKMFAEENNNE